MNLKHRPRRSILVVLFLILVLTVILGRWQFLKSEGEVQGVNEEAMPLKKIDYRERSPDGLREVIRYKVKFSPSFYKDYSEYYRNQTIIAVNELEYQFEDYVFTGDDFVGDPHWLGNEHVFFFTRCGTGCKGLFLADLNRIVKFGGIDTQPVDMNSFKTHFRDWFGEDHRFSGSVQDIRAETEGEKTILIFEMWDEDKPAGEKRFLFTGNSLEFLE